MRKIYLLLMCALMISAAKTNAQCSMAGRYNSCVFSGYTDTNVIYTNSTDATMIAADSMTIYQPLGDTFSKRPFIIMAHGGTFIGGSRLLNNPNTDPAIDTICLRFVKRGYVTVSIDYRVAASITDMITAGSGTGSAADVVAKAISDGKAAMRYLVQNASRYRLDTNNMFIGGNSAGAVLYMHVGYLDSVGECTPLMLGALNNNGGFNGNSSVPADYTPKAKGVIDLAGGLASVAIASPGDIPSVNCQGDLDVTVPYTCNEPLLNASPPFYCPDTLCGLGSLKGQYNLVGITHWDTVFAGQTHVPWNSNATMMNAVDSLTESFLYYMVCGTATSVNYHIECPSISSVNIVNTNAEIKVFPNPATEALNVNSSQSVSSITLYDETGRIVIQVNDINKGSYEINTSRLSQGVYFIRIRFSDENNSPVVKQVVIQ